jgi:hypothetical protein
MTTMRDHFLGKRPAPRRNIEAEIRRAERQIEADRKYVQAHPGAKPDFGLDDQLRRLLAEADDTGARK